MASESKVNRNKKIGTRLRQEKNCTIAIPATWGGTAMGEGKRSGGGPSRVTERDNRPRGVGKANPLLCKPRKKRLESSLKSRPSELGVPTTQSRRGSPLKWGEFNSRALKLFPVSGKRI